MSTTSKSAVPLDVNLYDAIGLDPQDTTEAIQEKLHDLKAGWTSKASRSGGQGEKAQQQIVLISRAEEVFADDDSREVYDLSLRRNPTPKVENAQVDWLTRAWNYYFVRDGGAADVASRFAREQNPSNPLAFVVSAWVKLLEGKDGQRQAKEFADEAFVLDELSQETADVHHVRGVVYFLLGDNDRALKSFDRALAAAADGEKPEILMRKAWVLERENDWSGVYELAVAGLSIPVPLSRSTEASLVESVTQSIIRLDEALNSPDATISNYKNRRAAIQDSKIQPDPKVTLLNNLDVLDDLAATNKTIRDRIATKQAQLKTAEQTKAPGTSQPDIPWIPIGIAILNIFLIGVWAIANAAWVPILFVLGFGGYAVYRLVARSNWTTSHAEWTRQSQTAERLRGEIGELERSLPSELQAIRNRLTLASSGAVRARA